MKAKKILSFALAFVMLLGIVNIPVFASETTVAKIGDESYVTLADAIKNAQDGEKISVVSAGTYTLPSFGKNITIEGTIDGVAVDMSKAVTLAGAKVTFVNITFDYGNNNYIGLHHVTAEIYNNCIINGQMFAYGDIASFTGCTFNQTSPDAYNIWTYGADVVTFSDCTFNSAGKSVLIYNEGGNPQEADFANCEFIASQEVEGKAAIEIDSTFCEFTVNTDETTTATGFSAGSVSGDSLWNVKKNSKDTLVSVNDTVVYTNVLPTATVTDITAAELKAGNAPALTFAKKFVANDVEETVLNFYGAWYADFVLTLNKDATFNADGKVDGYLAGQYDAWSENWVSVPFDNVTLKAGESLKIMEYAASLMGQSGLKYTYAEVYEFVKEFDCGIFFDADYLLANPDLEVTLELRIYNNEDETESYSIGNNYDFAAPQIIARIDDVGYADLQTAIDDANGKTVTLVKDVELTKAVEVSGKTTLDLNGKTITTASDWVKASGNDCPIVVLYGGDLAINDSSDGNGNIDGSKAYGAVKLTKSGETAADGKVAKLTVNGGTLTGNYYAVVGNGSRSGTEIVINGGKLTAIQEVWGYGIFHPQNGTLTVNGGEISAPTGIEMRAGTLNVTGGNIESTASELTTGTSDSGTTVSGSAIAVSQHNTNHPIAINVTGGTLSGPYAFYQNRLVSKYTPSTNISATISSNATISGIVKAAEEGFVMKGNADTGYELGEASDIFGGKFAIINMKKADNGDYMCAFGSGIDSLNYKEVGFTIYSNGEKLGSKSTRMVYSSVSVTSPTTGKKQTVTKDDLNAYRIFYLTVQFAPKWDNTEIQYQPYAVTLDGEIIYGAMTTVEDIYTLE